MLPIVPEIFHIPPTIFSILLQIACVPLLVLFVPVQRGGIPRTIATVAVDVTLILSEVVTIVTGIGNVAFCEIMMDISTIASDITPVTMNVACIVGDVQAPAADAIVIDMDVAPIVPDIAGILVDITSVLLAIAPISVSRTRLLRGGGTGGKQYCSAEHREFTSVYRECLLDIVKTGIPSRPAGVIGFDGAAGAHPLRRSWVRSVKDWGGICRMKPDSS